MMTGIRRRVLEVIFGLLYRRLGFLHETAGRAIYGSAWDGRRRHVVPTDRNGVLLDVGCGEGRLLQTIHTHPLFALGVEPSPVMARRARRRNVAVVQATAQALPTRSGSVCHVIATYPGPWIADQRTWDEIARVTVPGASVQILLGGDIVRGRGSFVRSRLMRLAYGTTNANDQMPVLGNAQITGGYVHRDDRWGTAILWSGTRTVGSAERVGTEDSNATGL